MRFTPVETLPKKKAGMAPAVPPKSVKSYFEEFMKMDVKYVRVDFAKYEYANRKSAYVSMKESVKYSGLPIEVRMRGGDIFFVRTDKEECV